MKTLNIVLAAVASLLALQTSLRAGEIKTLLCGVAGADTISIGEGESAKKVWHATLDSALGDVKLSVVIQGRTVGINAGTNPVISGPATIKVENTNNTSGLVRFLATFDITRVGQFTEPACIPIEAGSTFSVILESSSDLVNWTPANPGSYPGTDTKRFFRTRIVKL